MATVNKILKPRRGKKSTMAGTKASTVLAAGELFLEVPDTGVGKGKSKIKVGDGSTAYKSLPYALGDTSTDVITYSSNSSTSVATALNNVASGKTLANMIAGLKQAVSLLNTSVTSLNDDCAQLNSNLTIRTIRKNKTITIPANSILNNNVMNVNDVDGYIPVGIVGIYSDYPNVIIPTIYYINSVKELWFDVKNLHSESLTTGITFQVMYVSDGFTVTNNL